MNARKFWVVVSIMKKQQEKKRAKISSEDRNAPMISNTDAQSLIQASFFFNELFKRTVLSAPLPVSVTKTQMDILMALYSDGPMNMSTLSAKVYIAPEQATRAIHGLREKGLIASERNEENRRMVIARLTDTAILMLDDHMRDLNMTLQSNLDGLTDEEIAELTRAASTVVKLSQKTGIKYVLPKSTRS